jgi:hypothetical protein
MYEEIMVEIFLNLIKNLKSTELKKHNKSQAQEE